MGATSTLRVTRSAAEQIVLRRLLDVSDNELELMLDMAMRSSLYDSIVVPDGEPNDDDTARSVACR